MKCLQFKTWRTQEISMRVEWLVALKMVLVMGLGVLAGLNAQLEVGFYDDTCSSAEAIVEEEVTRAFSRDTGVAAGLLRMHFHDCFVRGCDGSVLIDSVPSNKAEKDSPVNNPSLRGFEVIDNAKYRLEAECPGVVSCADILAFAARDCVVVVGGLGYDVPAGRRDGRISIASETLSNLPGPTFTLQKLTQAFAKKGLTQDEMITLSGAHTIGRSHCTSITSRLYNFSSTAAQDPSLDPIYAAQLIQQCPKGSKDPNSVIPMNPGSPNFLDTGYYQEIVVSRGLFTSDQTLSTDQATFNQVLQNAADPLGWQEDFAAAMVKMGQIDVLTGSDGEIRLDCRKPN